ncbi:Uncharacterised protein [Acinetobacter baumannii]|nr:Uncharacterised protein [Acinetobacter baumannii]
MQLHPLPYGQNQGKLRHLHLLLKRLHQNMRAHQFVQELDAVKEYREHLDWH